MTPCSFSAGTSGATGKVDVPKDIGLLSLDLDGVDYWIWENVGLEVVLKAGRQDAEYSSRLLGASNPVSVKHTVEDEDAVERTHPTFFPLLEQWEQHAQAIQRLWVGEAFVRLPNDSVRRVRTPTLSAVSVSPQQLAAVQEYYLQRYFRPVPQPKAATPRVVTSGPGVSAPGPPPIRRHHPDETPEPSPVPVVTPDAESPGAILAPLRRLRHD